MQVQELSLYSTCHPYQLCLYLLKTHYIPGEILGILSILIAKEDGLIFAFSENTH